MILIWCLCSELEEKLKSISYPFIVSVLPDNEKKPLKTKAQQLAHELHEAQLKIAKEQNESKIKLCIDWLLKIEYNHLLARIDEFKTTVTTSSKTLLIKLFASPLEKRFKYHFSGNKKTNNLEKVTFESSWRISKFIVYYLKHF